MSRAARIFSGVAVRTDGGAGGIVTPPTDATIVTSDVTTNNASTTKHGWAPKLPDDNTKFYDGKGAWNVPPGATTAGSLLSATFTVKIGAGAPVDASDPDGSIYFRTDGGALTTIYQARAGVWVGIV